MGDRMKLVELVGKNISSRRRALGITQKDLAAQLEITQDALNRMEKGKIAPKMGRLESIAEHLQCPVSSLFINENEAAHEKAKAITEIVSTMPGEMQDVIMNMVASAAAGLLKITKK